MITAFTVILRCSHPDVLQPALRVELTKQCENPTKPSNDRFRAHAYH